jgi:Asp-tRNA(Asn)/Glu-tRNA(Gln) amidotransferase A subunit family amidase
LRSSSKEFGHGDEKATTMEACFLTASQAARQIRAGTLTSEALVRSCLERIGQRDEAVKAWLHVDPDYALLQARELDGGTVTGLLHGLPIAVKDIMDTGDMPTTCNSLLYQGYRPTRDAACVAVVRRSGVVILGKTDTVEFASGGRRAATRHPTHPSHTPGGSSSGSAAAVADAQVPISFGTQTAGSLVRPASFTGTYAFKPTWGTVATEGTKPYSPTLDTVGWFGREVADLTLMARAFCLPNVVTASTMTPSQIKVAICETPFWPKAEAATKQALSAATERLSKAGAQVQHLVLPKRFQALSLAQDTIMCGEGRVSYLAEYLNQGQLLDSHFVEMVENRRGITGQNITAAQDFAAECRKEFDALFADIDVVVAPAASGEAPEGLQFTGDPIFNSMWTLLHVPCIAIPCTTGPRGLPVGVQVIGPRRSDARLLAISECLGPVIDCQ